MEVQEYIAYVSGTLIPNNLKGLQLCKSAKDITQWRKSHFKTLTDSLATGENHDQPKNIEELKEEISFSKRIFLAAKNLEEVVMN